jgi:hypothetical protein
MLRAILALALTLCLAVAAAPVAQAQGTAAEITEQEAHALGVDAYVYFYPFVSMDVTRRQLTNLPAGEKGFGGPANRFSNSTALHSAEVRAVVRTNFDTLFSTSFLDTTREPVIITVPDTNGRYYLLPMLDMWTDVFAVPGWRTTGTGAGNFLVVPPGWRPDIRDKVVEEFKLPNDIQRIDAPTPHVWIIGRIKLDGPRDYAVVHKIQAGLKITPLSAWGKPEQPVEQKIDPAVDLKTPPKIQVDTMPAGKFFAYAAELLKVNPPHLTDQPILAQMRRIGIVRGQSFDFEKLPPAVRKGLETAPEAAHALMKWKLPTLARVANNWGMNTDTMGVYGNFYLKRAIVATEGLGANLPEDAIYPFNFGDESGKPLDGSNRYTITFEKGATPPVNAFWSITLYDAEGFQVGNVLDRFAVSSWMPFQYNADGSLTLHFQNESPGRGREANWLPAPKGPFNLTMRLYAPKAEALTGKWNPPPVIRVQALPALTAN